MQELKAIYLPYVVRCWQGLIRGGWSFQHHRRRNLQQFCFLLSWRLCSTWGAKWFLQRYGAQVGWSEKQLSRERRLIIMAKVCLRLSKTIANLGAEDWLGQKEAD